MSPFRFQPPEGVSLSVIRDIYRVSVGPWYDELRKCFLSPRQAGTIHSADRTYQLPLIQLVLCSVEIDPLCNACAGHTR